MNTKNLKAYAPKARAQFIDAIKKRAAQLGIYEDKIAEVLLEGGAAIIEGRAFSQKQGQQRQQLERKINGRSEVTHTERYNLFIREMAYTWFNRLAAIRYMELHDYFDHGFRVLSAAKNHSSSQPSSQNQLPEILDNASDVADSLALNKSDIIELQLAGNKEEELYRELLLGQCHYLYRVMPFMFEQLDDATELLLPGNLTKTDSILKGLVNEIPEEDWSEIEVIGWLYQFYISEYKDAVIGKVVKSEDIPAATQLFTPNWIVKYLVQNSLGRQWLATYPESELKGKMEYYIEPAEQSDDVIEQLKAITPTSIDPEQIKVLDPAAGSGHILVEVYEVLREIYLERGYRLREIPELILTKNIYGLDIDDRAAQLAGFALMMKAREDDRRIFDRIERGEVTLNVFSLQSSENLNIDELWHALNLEGNQKTGSTGGLFDELEDELQNQNQNQNQNDNSDNNNVGRALARQNDTDDQCDGLKPNLQSENIYTQYFVLLQTLKTAFLQAKTLGSLIQIDNEYLQSLVALKELLQAKVKSSDPSAKQAASELLPIVNQAVCLALKYCVVVANPPYIGIKYHIDELKVFLKNNYSGFEKDLFAAFIKRCVDLTSDFGDIGLMTPNVWMYIYTHEALRSYLINESNISNLIELPLGGFRGATVQICAFSLSKHNIKNTTSNYIRLIGKKGGDDELSSFTRGAIANRTKPTYFECENETFKYIPGSPIAYWSSSEFLNTFRSSTSNVRSFAESEGKNVTTDNAKYVRFWWEINKTSIGKNEKWLPFSKGGAYRKWYGNDLEVVDWSDSALNHYRNSNAGRLIREEFWFLKGITWSKVTSSRPSFRVLEHEQTYQEVAILFSEKNERKLDTLLGLLNSSVCEHILKVLSPTLNYQQDDICKIPWFKIENESSVIKNVKRLLEIAKFDFNSFETSKGFCINPLIQSQGRLSAKHDIFLNRNNEVVQEAIKLEKSNNTIFIDAFSLEGELNSNVRSDDITLDLNPLFLFKGGSECEIENRYQASTLVNLLHYSLGCMMGRYSLDREGLIYAHSGSEGFKDLVAEGAYKTFPADDDGIIPLASEAWLFDDDATARFREFVKTVWGDEHQQDNLEFVAESLCLHALKPVKSESAMDTVRRYFSKQFYKDHCKTYKKRPIYWLFSSGKEKAFECLVYLHRYNEGTLSRMRTEYVTPLMGKYEAQHSLLAEQKVEATTTEARRIEKELKSLEKKQAELRTFDEQLKHYAEMRITLDLDDGVKVNYGKFGNLLADVKAIHGKAVK